MSGASSNTSGASIGGDASRRRGGFITGIPKRCRCGEETVGLTSKSDKNPYRRYYRRAYAVRKKLENDNHVFKWIDERLMNEVEALQFKTARLEQELREIKTEDNLMAERVHMKVEKELFDKVEEVLVEAKGSLKRMMIVCIIGCVCVCLVSWNYA